MRARTMAVAALALVAGLSVLGSTPAWAGPWKIDPGSTTYTAATGKKGEERRTFQLDAKNPTYLTSLELTRRGVNDVRATCRVGIHGQTMAGKAHYASHDACSPGYAPTLTEIVSAKAGGGQVIRAVSVCTNGTDATVSGVRIRTRKLSDGSTSKVFDGPVEVRLGEMSDCRKWEDFVVCPDRAVVVGLSLRFRYDPDALQQRSLVGLSLSCAALVRK